MQPKPLGINISTFSELIKEGCIYVDKTEIIYQLINSKEKNYFLARPRRFGKSLLVSTFAALFAGRKELFKDCWIAKSDYDWKIHPVLSLDFSELSLKSPELFELELKNHLLTIAHAHGITILEATSPSAVLAGIVKQLALQAPVVLLIDEYDASLLFHLHEPSEALAMQRTLCDLFTTVKSLNQYLRFVFLTGVSKFTRTSVFSGLNNLQDLTMSATSATLLGYTEQEIQQYFGKHLSVIAPGNEQELLNKMRVWYNGYRFSSANNSVFTPYSILLFLRDSGAFKNYWFTTATPSFLINLLKKEEYNLDDLNKPRMSESELGSFELEYLPLTTLLYQTGYLTIKEYDTKTEFYLLDYPNHEVRESFIESIAKLCTRLNQSKIQTYTSKLLLHIKNRSMHDFLLTLQDFFKQIPYTLAIENEKTVQLILYALCNLIGLDVQAEIATHLGRIDITLTTKQDIFIIELKYNESAQKAIDQINKQEYYTPYLKSEKAITLVGVSFDKKTRTLADDWLILPLHVQ